MGMSPDDLIAGGIPGAEEEATSEGYLGVPKDYMALRPRDVRKEIAAVGGDPSKFVGEPPVGEIGIAPRYREGDQYRPQAYAPELRMLLQGKMDQVGLYGKGDRYRLGDWQETDSAVYAKVLKYANRYGYSVDEALSQMTTLTAEERTSLGLGRSGSGGGKGGTSSEPLVVSLSHPDDIRDLADRTARKTLGRKLTADQLSNFVRAYQNMERESQQATYAADVTGGTVTKARDPGVFAEQAVTAADPLAAEAKKEVEVFKVISGALGGIRGQR